MAVMKDYPFISVSTDLDICCDCCEKGHSKFKCPGSMKDQIPSADNLPYLELRNGETKLKTNSEYYFQVQGQMGVTGRTYTDFFVFTFKGFHKERIQHDSNYWSDLLEKMVWFWQKCVGPELINQSLKHRLEEQKTCEEEENANLPTKVVRESPSKTIVLVSKRVSSNVEVVKKKPSNSKGKAKTEKKAKLQMASVCLCGTSKMDVLDVPTSFEEESIKCDTCPIWYNFKCVGVTPDSKPSKKDSFICSQCKDH